MTKQVHIIAGGTVVDVAPHFGVCADAYGSVGNALKALFQLIVPQMDVTLHLTRMAGGGDGSPRTNSDVEELLGKLVAAPETRVIVMAAAICDFEPRWIVQKDDVQLHRDLGDTSGRKGRRLRTSSGELLMSLKPSKKLLPMIRNGGTNGEWPVRKDVFLVGFSATSGDSEVVMYRRALEKLKTAGANLMFANDICTGACFVVAPEETYYHMTYQRDEALKGLVEMVMLRTNLTFTRSNVVAGDPVAWSDARVPENLRTVVNHMIMRGAYKPFGGKTAGHFAVKLNDMHFLTSRRKSNFNDLERVGLVEVTTDAPDSTMLYGSEWVYARGGKPSVGGQSQRIVFRDHPGYDCIVHAHVPIKPGSAVNVVSQREYECGSHECGKNTSNGLVEVAPGIKAMMLDGHGPNVVFGRSTPAVSRTSWLCVCDGHRTWSC